ncbi:MAG: type II toxin-antitoxin system RelE/ParE family toxin [Silvibacterium sp.]|nr:type II toxin-antitoxin system RelE/ParE family toxin [Silvibacterium sp.]
MRIRWTSRAVEDLTGICDYIQESGRPETARRVAVRIHQRIALLARFPQSGRAGRKEDTRELVITGLPYIVMYRIRENVIEVLRILHGAQKWPEV